MDDDQMSDGYCLASVTYATGDMAFRTHCEDDLKKSVRESEGNQ